ncbi:MAG: discoidin domain-containing protein [bacterium]|nr:discoidin domain-containing protein [bacterium]
MILLAVPMGFAQEAGEGIELNGGFEKTEDVQGKLTPAGWVIWEYVKDGSMELVKETYEGKYALKLTALAGNDKKGLIIHSEKFPVVNKEKITFQVALKGSKIPFMMMVYDEKGKELTRLYQTGASETGKWTVNTLVFPVDVAGAVSGRLFISCPKGQEVAVDALEVKKKPVTEQITRTGYLPEYQPFISYNQAWPLGRAWTSLRIGNKDFYFAEQGNYIRMNKDAAAKFYDTGLLQRMIPGHWMLKYFDPREYEKAAPAYKGIVDDFLKNKWPLHSIEYCSFRGNPIPSKESLDAVTDIWIGDGQPEEPIYRLEPVKHYMETGKLWQGSSMYIGNEAAVVDYFKNVFMPELRKAIPDCEKPDKKWTGREVKILSDIYCDTYTRKLTPMVWTMYLSPYEMAVGKAVKTVAQKGCDAGGNAVTRGIMRQSGGNKFFYVWRGHEPAERYAYSNNSTLFNRPDREGWGVPLPYLRYYIFRPFLCGANYYMNEAFPVSLTEDLDEDGNASLSPLGEIAMDMLDYVERHPNRGTTYSPVALLDRWDTEGSPATTFKISDYDFDAKSMNIALQWDLLWPEHRDSTLIGGYNRTAPYGEIIDILRPNPYVKAAPALFDGYKLLIMSGGQKMSREYALSLQEYVKAGGSLVVNAADVSEAFSVDFAGAAVGNVFRADTAVNCRTKVSFKENSFTAYELTPGKGTEVLYATDDGKPLVTLSRYGQGYVVLVGARYMVQDRVERLPYNRDVPAYYDPNRKPLLSFTPDMFEHLLAGVTPFDIKVNSADKPDISWQINRNGAGWTVTVFNYSQKREELVAKSRGTACADAFYPLKEIPFEIVCRDATIKDVVELYGDRDVNWKTMNGEVTVNEATHGGEIRVYEFQPVKIVFPERERYVNYALGRPVKASSQFMHYKPEAAVDGDVSNSMYWASGMTNREFPLPQWLEIDLGQERQIDHIYVKLHHWENADPETRKFIVKYVVEASQDGKNWTAVVDERNNIAPVKDYGLERWFDPVSARYVRLTVLKNSGHSGARVAEIKVMGQEKESYKPERKSIIPKWQVEFPGQIDDPKKKQLWLADLKPEKAEVGWIFPGKTWEDMKGEIKLFTGNDEGLVCPKSLFAESVSDIIYKIPSGAEWFAAVPGIGAPDSGASVEFEVYVDGMLKYKSPSVVRVGQRLIPVVVNVSDAKEIRLHVTDGGDGIVHDYSWWGVPRFVLK